jgi:hypothetical protein
VIGLAGARGSTLKALYSLCFGALVKLLHLVIVQNVPHEFHCEINSGEVR